MATGTFSCPKCKTSSPFVEAMLGRRLRCQACGQPFQLNRSGEAIAIAEAAVRPLRSGSEAGGNAPGQTGKQAPSRERVGRLRDQLNSRLARSANDALQGISGSDGAETLAVDAAGFIPASRPHPHRRWRRWSIAAVLFGLLVSLGLVLLPPNDSPEQRALRALTIALSEVAGGPARGEQVQAVWRQYCWSQDRHLPVIVNVDRGTIVDRQRVVGQVQQDIAALLLGLRRVEGYDLWVDQSAMPALRSALPAWEAQVLAKSGGGPGAEPDLELLMETVRAAGIQVQTSTSLLARLAAIDKLPMVVQELARQQILDGNDEAAFFRQPPPPVFSLFTVCADDGAVLRKQGATWFFDHQAYEAYFLAAEGGDWPPGYRLVKVRIQP